ncbi:uncharacterized protein PHA67_004433 isoform 1-T1 [Liasis olivaceus]
MWDTALKQNSMEPQLRKAGVDSAELHGVGLRQLPRVKLAILSVVSKSQALWFSRCKVQLLAAPLSITRREKEQACAVLDFRSLCQIPSPFSHRSFLHVLSGVDIQMKYIQIWIQFLRMADVDNHAGVAFDKALLLCLDIKETPIPFGLKSTVKLLIRNPRLSNIISS